MSTTPPEPPTESQRPSGPTVNFNVPATLPIPGNAELAVYIIATIIVGIITLSDSNVNAPEFARWFTYLTIGYVVSRGIAKASRVLEQ
jgi:hypothetical protein